MMPSTQWWRAGWLRFRPIAPANVVRIRALLIAAALIAGGIVISRRPDAFTNAQFYAEDGTRWFADAYNVGAWQTVLTSYEGYFQVLSRLAAIVEAPFGVSPAPLIFNVIGLLIQIAPVVVFMSRRFEPVVPSFGVRAVVSAIYLLMPSTELNVTITNAQFHLALLALLVVLAPPSRNWLWRAFDITTVALTGITGPFVYVLVPLCVLWFVMRRRQWTIVVGGVLALGLGAQLYAATLSQRTQFGLGANLHVLAQLLSDRVLLAGLFSEEGHTHVFVNGLPHASVIAGVVILVALPVGIAVMLRAPLELRAFCLAAAALLAAGLAAPLVSANGSQWEIMLAGRAGERYFFLAQVAWVLSLMWVASRLRHQLGRVAGYLAIAACFVSGLVAAWSYPPFVDYHWPQEAAAIDRAAAGTREIVPIPPGPPWTVEVVAK